MMDQVDHVRSQIPLVAAGIGNDRDGGEGGSHLHHHNLLKIRIAEQEIERQRKKVRLTIISGGFFKRRGGIMTHWVIPY